MEGNPFITLAGMMKPGSGGSGRMIFGKIAGLQPLTVSALGLSLSGEALIVNAELIETRKGSISGTASGGGSVSGSCSLPPALKVGDGLMIWTEDYQTFYVICKAVSG